MRCELGFVDSALQEWGRLDPAARRHLKEELLRRLAVPRVRSAKLAGAEDRYKIELRAFGHQLVYEVRDSTVVVVAITVG